MSDLRKQIRDHYESRELPPEKLAAILAQGEAVAKGVGIGPRPVAPRRRIVRIAAWAAVFIALATVVTLLVVRRDRAEFAAVRPVVVDFFAHELKYPILSPNPVALRQWALDHGAPADFRIPASLQVLPGKGCCTILDVEGKKVHMLCFMTVRPDGTQDGGMVHLLIARRSDFHHAPASSSPEIVPEGEWHFASWTENDITYTVAAPLRRENLRPYLVRIEALREYELLCGRPELREVWKEWPAGPA